MKKLLPGFAFLLFCFFCLKVNHFYSKKLNDIELQRPTVRFSTTSDNLDKATTMFGLEDSSFERLQKGIRKRGPSAQNFLVSGIILIEQTSTYFFSLNANKAARLTIDGQDISRSSVFEKELNQIVPLYMQKGAHFFTLHYTPSSQGAYLQLLWKQSIDQDFHLIPSDMIFSPKAENLSLEEIRDVQSKTQKVLFIKHNALILFLVSVAGFVLWIFKVGLKINLLPVQEKTGKAIFSGRLTDIDKTKGLAGFLMIMIHLDGANIFPFGFFGASLFFFCSGMNTILFIQRSHEKKNYNLYHIFFVVLLFFGGFTQIVISHPDESRFVPEFLQVSALSILLILLLSKLFKNIHHVGFLFPVPFVLHLLYQNGVFSLPDILPQFTSFIFGSAAFPLFPWSGFFLFGVFLLRLRSSTLKLFWVFITFGFLSIFSVYVLHIPVEKFDMSLSYILLSLCTSALWFYLFHLLSSSSKEQRLRWLFSPLEVVGRNSLMFVYVHYFALSYIPVRNFISPPLYMLLLSSAVAFLFCVFCVYYYERSKQDPSLFIPALLMLVFLLFLQYGGYLSVLADIKLISILVGVLFAFLYVQLRWKLRILLK
ncbi:MAG: acyltransferase [Candidatus Aminicenantes bacterium]|nr:acyltransferase [Candidatus Aminicenantes bacterium]